MTSKERVLKSLNHESPDKLAVDFGATAVTGMHVLIIEKLREYYGLEKRPVKVTDPYQMLGEVDDDLKEIIGIDTIGINPPNNMFGFSNKGEKEFKTFWGQEVLVPEDFNTKLDKEGNLLIFPEGDMSIPPSGKMPFSSYFFDSIIRQQPIDEDQLKVEDNLEEFELISDEDLNYWRTEINKVKDSDKAIVANFGGTALGDIALVPAPFLKNPKGIRDVTEWYMSTAMRIDFIKEIFEKQSDIALHNLQKIFGVVGNSIDVLFLCGTDFGTQTSTFCSSETFEDLYAPYYRKMNDWIHQNTNWKIFKHSCGAVESFMTNFINAGIDIINPVQISATDMDSKNLKQKYGDDLTFWGGGVDTQKVLSFGTHQEVKKQVQEQIHILSENGGFIFNTVHNVQANVPVENMVALIDIIRK